MPFPEVYRVGVAWDALPGRLNLSADVEVQRWSTYEELAITFIDDEGGRETIADPKNSKDSLVVHVGGEYRLSDAWQVRAGYVWDQRTTPEETVGPAPPDSDRHVIALGASFLFDNFGVHAHLADVLFVPRESSANRFRGTWRGGYPLGTTAYLASLGFSAAFGAAPPPAPPPPPAEIEARNPWASAADTDEPPLVAAPPAAAVAPAEAPPTVSPAVVIEVPPTTSSAPVTAPAVDAPVPAATDSAATPAAAATSAPAEAAPATVTEEEAPAKGKGKGKGKAGKKRQPGRSKP
jgi:hypothetical protein